MADLIAALTILQNYTGNIRNPTHCEHDVLYVVGVDPMTVPEEERAELKRLGFLHDTESFYSFRFGSA